MREFKKFQFFKFGRWMETVGIVDDDFLCQNPDCNRRLTCLMRIHTKSGEKKYHYCPDCRKSNVIEASNGGNSEIILK